MQEKPDVAVMHVGENGVDAACVETAGTPLDTMHLVSLAEDKFSHVGSVLPCDPGN